MKKYMILFIVLMAWCGLLARGWAAEPLPRFKDCARFAWKYESHPLLAAFRIYTSQQSGVYRIDPKDPSKSRPDVVIPAIPTLITEAMCTKLHLPRPGTWYAVLTAVSKDGTIESQPSDEITLTYGPQANGETDPKASAWVWVPPWGTAPYTVPPPLPPLPLMAPLPGITAPSGGTSGQILSESCLWKGTCR